MKRPDCRGFTLLELLISLTIFTVVAVIVYATLSFCSRAVESGEARSNENQRARAALTLISRQLKSAYPLSLQAEGETFVYFFGEPDGVSFVSAAGRPEAGGLEKVTYFLREDGDGRRGLWVRTSAPTLPADLLNDREGGLRQETEVLPEVESVTWEYLGPVQNPGSRSLTGSTNRGRLGTLQNRAEWNERWSGKQERRLPTAVRISWKARLGELPYEWSLEVPLNAYYPPPDVLGAPQGGEGSTRHRRFGGRERE
ncbi:MAG TPA: prepilin-type N-terminal cleavage/methylation domain-containing protein [Candidatus Binatia bacterium]|nr:prepilin-type N-terminal cleavage/methylation domain-containing protein [Candidatus Binatia bacterium]